MFLPMMMIDLRERFPTRKPMKDRLATVAQLVVLYHFLREPLDGVPLGQIASKLNYSAMAVSKAQDELEMLNLAETMRSGRTVSLRFMPDRKRLWEKSEPLFSTPVKRTYWIRWEKGQERQAVSAGLTALSQYSMLADDRLPTFAMRDRDFMKVVQDGELGVTEGSDDAKAKMEGWKYDPHLLAENGIADRCSLYLSLRNNADERVQKEIQDLVIRFNDYWARTIQEAFCRTYKELRTYWRRRM